MGANTSTEETNEESILRHPQEGEASDLYWACRAGDIDTVQRLITLTPYIDINRLEPNGSTALHAACFFGHANIVRLLLHQYGVISHRRNYHDLTAYEEAATDEIRQLFHRPSSSQRFCSSTTSDAEHLFAPNVTEQSEDEDDEPDNWVRGANKEGAGYHSASMVGAAKTLTTSPYLQPLIQYLIRRQYSRFDAYDENTAAETLRRRID
ncbi:unnamed protein product, partial [Rotaria sp. Silwood1]